MLDRGQTRARVGVVVVMLGAVGTGLFGCDQCAGIELATRTFRADLRPAPGTDEMSSEQVLDYGDYASAMAAPRWEAAIADAAQASSGWGSFAVSSADKSLSLVLPFPLVLEQTLPLVANAQTAPNFSYDPGRGVGLSLYPSDAVAGWLTYTGPGPACTREAPEICAAQAGFRRQQSIEGTVGVISVTPLRLAVTATISYPEGSGWAPVVIVGDVDFDVQAGQVCQPES